MAAMLVLHSCDGDWLRAMSLVQTVDGLQLLRISTKQMSGSSCTNAAVYCGCPAQGLAWMLCSLLLV